MEFSAKIKPASGIVLVLMVLGVLTSFVGADVNFDSIFAKYNKSERPNYNGDAVAVTLTGYILSLPEIDSKAQEISWNLYFRQSWRDSRLIVSKNTTLPAEYWDKIWVPDTFIVNELASTAHAVTVPNTMIKLSEERVVMKSTRYTVRTTCPMDLRNFPFDEQKCSMSFESYGYTAKDITYEWKQNDNPVGYESQSHLEFNIIALRVNSSIATLASGRYCRAWVDILIRRESGRYMKEFYYPCLVLVVLSFVSVCVLGPYLALIFSFLTVGFTILFAVESTGALESPRIGYATALDEYLAITLSFVLISFFISLIQFRLNKGRSSVEALELSSLGQGRSRVPDSDDVNLCEDGQGRRDRRPVIPPGRIEAALQFVGGVILRLMPIIKPLIAVLYGLVNLIYWTTRPYAGISGEETLRAEAWKM